MGTTQEIIMEILTLYYPMAIICNWIWQNPASTHRATLRDMAISSNDCIVASWWITLKEWKSQQVLLYSLAIIVWVNNFQTPKIQAVLSIFFRDGNDIAGGSNRGGGWR